MATLVAHKVMQSTAGNEATSSAADTTGATLFVIGSNEFNSVTTPTDSASNTWVGLTVVNWLSALLFSRIWYVLNPTTSASHIFQIGGTGTFPSGAVQAWDTYNEYDGQQSGVEVVASDAFIGNQVTPTVNNSLIISFLGQQATPTGTPTIDLSFTVSDFCSANTQSEVSAMGYLELGTAASKNPTWTRAGSGSSAVLNAVFRTAAGGAGKPANYYAMQARQYYCLKSKTWKKHNIPYLKAA